MTDIDELEQLAKEATPGPWYRGTGSECHEICKSFGPMIGKVYGYRDGDFIAAANPAAVLEMVAEIRQSRAKVIELEWYIDEHRRAALEAK